MENPDFVLVAQAYRIAAQRVEAREHLREAVQTMLSTPGPYLLEVTVAKEENVFPMVPSGASISAIKLEA